MQFKLAIRTLALVAAVGVAACGREDKTADTNATLQNDLALAAQQQTQLDSISALEAGTAATAAGNSVGAPASVRRATTSSAPRRTTTTTRRSASGTAGTATRTSSGTVTSTSGGEVVIEKNTKRDAAIGAAAGAVIGATTSRDKVKGAIIGGVVGGVIGGVIGNNVDVKKTRKPPL